MLHEHCSPCTVTEGGLQFINRSSFKRCSVPVVYMLIRLGCFSAHYYAPPDLVDLPSPTRITWWSGWGYPLTKKNLLLYMVCTGLPKYSRTLFQQNEKCSGTYRNYLNTLRICLNIESHHIFKVYFTNLNKLLTLRKLFFIKYGLTQ